MTNTSLGEMDLRAFRISVRICFCIFLLRQHVLTAYINVVRKRFLHVQLSMERWKFWAPSRVRGIRIDKVWVVADVGKVVDPINFENQVQGGVVWGRGYKFVASVDYRSAGAYS